MNRLLVWMCRSRTIFVGPLPRLIREEETTILFDYLDWVILSNSVIGFLWLIRGQEILMERLASSRRPFGKMKTLSFDLTTRSKSSSLSLWGVFLIWPLIDKEILSILNSIVHATSRPILSSKPIWFWGPWFEDGRYEYWRYYPSLLSKGALRWSNCGDVINPLSMQGFRSWLAIESTLFFIGSAMSWVLCGFYLWKAVFDSSQEPLIQGFSMADITLYIIIMSFVTNLLTRSDSSFMIGDEVKGWFHYHALVATSAFCGLLPFTELGSKWLILSLLDCHFKCHCFDENLIWARDCRSAGTNYPLSFSLTLAYLINFFFNICFGFSAFVFKNLWGSNYLRLP